MTAKSSPTARRIIRSPVRMEDCGMANAASILGDRWTLLILRSALYGVSRFDDFKSELSIGRSVLSGRLADLVSAGLLAKTEYRETADRARPEYRPTAAARDLVLVFAALQQWGDRWVRKKAPAARPRKRESREILKVGFVPKDAEVVANNDVTMG